MDRVVMIKKKSSTPPGTPKAVQSSSPQSSPRKNTTNTVIVPVPTSYGKPAAKSIALIPPTTKTQAQTLGYLRPQSLTEQYWAARALKAETRLSSSIAHQRELRSLSSSEETKRLREIASLSTTHEWRQARLEKFVDFLLVCVGALMLSVIYLLASSKRHESPVPRWRLPSHFTIPILSPFTSVVEHETSTIGTRSITVVVIILATFAYIIFRHKVKLGRSV